MDISILLIMANLLMVIIPRATSAETFSILDSVLKPHEIPKFAEPLKLFSASAPSLYTGSYRHTVPIAVPPSRTGLAPEVALEYDSNGEDGPLGKGWSLKSDRIFRSLSHGTPHYEGPAGQSDEDEFVYQVAAESGVLVFVRSTAEGLLYRPKSERGLFAKFYYRSGDESWIVRTQDGITRTFGGKEARDVSGGDTFGWNISEVTNPDGDRIVYTWVADAGGLYLSKIEYDLGKTAPHPHPPRVEFAWKSVPSLFHKSSYRTGYRTVLNARELLAINTIACDESGHVQSRKYQVRYDEPYNNPARTVAEILPQDLPFTRFSYYAPPKAFTGYRYMPDPDTTGPFASAGEQTSLRSTKVTPSSQRTTSMLADVDGDGKQDMIYVRSHHDYPNVSGNTWYWRQNLDDHWGPEQPLSLPFACAQESPDEYGCHPDALIWERKRRGSVWDGIDRYQTLMDMNGDGAVDIVFVQRSPIASGVRHEIVACLATGIPNAITYVPKVYYREDQPGSGVGLALYSNSSGSLLTPWFSDITLNWDETDLIDMNGDSTPDLVRTSGDTKLAVRLLDGTGNFRPVDMEVPSQWDVSLPHGCIRYTTGFGNGLDQVSCQKRSMVDMNGDLLLDLLVFTDPTIGGDMEPQRPASVKVYYGTGRGFDLDNPQEAGVMNHPFNQTFSSGIQGEDVGIGEVSGYHDLNGDGYPDYVYWAFHNPSIRWTWESVPKPSLTVILNDGGNSMFTTGFEWNLCAQCPSLPLATMGLVGVWRSDAYAINYSVELRQEFMDIDGDGRSELVCVVDTGPKTPFVIYKDFNGQPPRKLSRVETGAGWQTDISYGRPQQNSSRVPLPLWPVASVTVTDKVTGNVRIDHIDSMNPKYDPKLGEFFGYQEVQVSDEEKLVSHLYLQDENAGGLEFRTETYVRPGQERDLRKRVRTQYDWIATGDTPQDTRQWWRPKTVTTTVFDPGADLYSTETQFEYYDGNFQGCDGGSTGRTLGQLHARVSGLQNQPERKESYSYECVDTDLKYLVRTTKFSQTDLAGLVESRTVWLYDDQCLSPSAGLSKGKVCATRVYRGQDASSDDFPEGVTRIEYDSLGRISKVTDPDLVVTAYEYWGNTGLLKREVKAPKTLAHTRYFANYHPHSGKPGVICGPQFLSNVEADKCDRTEYDLWGRPTEVWLALDDGDGGFKQGKVRTYEYHDFYDHGVPERVPFMKTTEYPDPLGLRPGSDAPRVYLAYFNGWGNIIQEVRSSGGAYAKNYFQYDKQDRLSGAWQPIASGDALHLPLIGKSAFTYQYDIFSRFIGVENGGGKKKSATYLWPQATLRDEVGNTTVFLANAFGDIIERTQRADGSTLKCTFSYDAAGRMVKAVDEDGAVYQYDYYKDGNIRVATLPVGIHTSVRTPGGKVQLEQRGDGGSVAFEFDELGRTKRRKIQSGSGPSAALVADAQEFSYDSTPAQLGHLAEVAGSRFRQRFGFDALGHLRSKKLEDLQSGASLEYEKLYNALGDEVEMRYPSGRALSHTYDSGGRLAKITDSASAFTVDEFKYDPDQLLRAFKITIQRADGSTTDFRRALDYSSYPGLNGQRRLEKIRLEVVAKIPPAQVHETMYTYYDNNLVQTMSDPSRNNLNHAWNYNEANRLTSAWGYTFGGAGNQEYKFIYNPNGSLHRMSVGGKDFDFTRTAKNETLLSLDGDNEHTSYSFDLKVGEIYELKFKSKEDKYERQFRWAPDGTLANSKQSGGRAPFATSYEYDHAGFRWRRNMSLESGKNVTLFLDDVAELRNGKEADCVTLPQTRCVLPLNGAGTFYFSDRTDVAYVYADDGQLKALRSYLPYGGAAPGRVLNSEPVEFGFGGHQEEPDSGLVFFGARYYDPKAAQFLSADPARVAGSDDALARRNTLQPYVLSAANPTTYVDARGTDVELAESPGAERAFPLIWLNLKFLAAQRQARENAETQQQSELAAQAEQLRQIERHHPPVIDATGHVMTKKAYDEQQYYDKLKSGLTPLRGNIASALTFWLTENPDLAAGVGGFFGVFGNSKGGCRDPRPYGSKPFGSGLPTTNPFGAPPNGAIDPQWRVLDQPLLQIGPHKFISNPVWSGGHLLSKP